MRLSWADALAPVSADEVGLLCSYHFARKGLGGLGTCGAPLLIDSGAYSAFTQGAEVTLSGYSAWLARHTPPGARYVGLDVIHDARATWRNLAVMRAKGLRDAIPTLHVGADPGWVDRYADRGHTYMALGGIVAKTMNVDAQARDRWISRCFGRSTARGVSLHGFGVAGRTLAEAFPWSSMDSSTWTVGTRYGRLTLFDADRGTWLPQQDVRDRRLTLQALPLLRRYNLDGAGLLHQELGSMAALQLAILRSFIAYQRHVRQTRPGFQVYLAASPREAMMVFEKLTEET